jgi:hypothetical protein
VVARVTGNPTSSRNTADIDQHVVTRVAAKVACPGFLARAFQAQHLARKAARVDEVAGTKTQSADVEKVDPIGRSAARRRHAQPQVLEEGIEIAIVVEQDVAVADSVGGDEGIDGLANGHPMVGKL